MTVLSLSLLGPFRGAIGGQVLRKFRTNKVQALLIYLMVEAIENPELVHRRSQLMALLWPGLPDQSAQTNLRQTVYRLRRAIPEVQASNGQGIVPFIVASRQTVQINPEAAYDLDVAIFRHLLTPNAERFATGLSSNADYRAQLQQAVDQYQGDFLADFYLPDSDEFEDWAAIKRAEFRRQGLEALDMLTRIELHENRYDQAQVYARRQLDLDNLRESAYRQLMRALAYSGQRSEAMTQYDQCRQRLQQDLGVEPAPETMELYEQIQLPSFSESDSKEPEKALPATLVTSSPAVASAKVQPTPHNLPPQPTAFIGREAELAALAALIGNANIRLITLVGPGGMGKTRLALAVAERQLAAAIAAKTHSFESRFPDGIYFTPLASINRAVNIAPTIAQALPIDPESMPTTVTIEGQVASRKEALLEFLRPRRLLLLLDNFEHLLDGTSFIDEILQEAPGIKLLLTSRERLNLHEEQIFPVQGLDFPDWLLIDDQPSGDTVTRYTSAQLFMQSAQRMQPDFALTDEDLPHLAQICRLVAGMPLGVELAAAWVDMLSLADIAAEIEQSLDFLETNMRNMPERHRSIRAVCDASWQRLNQTEQTVFAQLSVFRGEFTRSAAQQVTGASLRQLATLVNKSLLQYSKDHDRYKIHELLRQYGADQLAQTAEDALAVRHKHSTYYCAWLAQQADALQHDQSPTVLTRIEWDIGNAKAAWFWAVRHQRFDHLAQALDGLCAFYEWSNRSREGETACREAANQLTTIMGQKKPPTDEQLRLLIRLLAYQSTFNRALGQTTIAHQLLTQASALLEDAALNDQDTRRERAIILQQLGWLAFDADDYAEARNLQAQSLAFYQALDDRVAVANTLNALGGLALSNGDFHEALQRYQASLVFSREQGNPLRLAASLEWVASVARDADDFGEARKLYQESLSLYQQVGKQAQAAHCQLMLSELAMVHADD